MGIKEDEKFIKSLNDNKALAEASESDVDKYKELVTKLSKKDNIVALDALASSSYGGDRAFECNWELAEEIYHKLLKLTNDSYYANTLGYIYYYGRTGKPDFNKAWYYFSIGALGGWHESKYKMADMLIKGEPVVKNVELAGELLQEVYNESILTFRDKEYKCNFPDIALRIGNYIKDVLIPDNIKFLGWNHEKALHFYLQAKFAMQKRMEVHEFFGNETVMNNIDKAIEEVSKSVAFQTDMTHITGHSLGNILLDSLNPGVFIQAKISKDKRSIHLTALDMRQEPKPAQFFITIADANFCNFVDSFDLNLEKDAKINILNTMNEKDPNLFILQHSEGETYGTENMPMFAIEGEYSLCFDD